DVLPIRGSMYVLSLINTNFGQAGVAYYLSRKANIGLLEAVSSVLVIAVAEIYQLLVFSTLGVIFYVPRTDAQAELTHALRIAYVIAWAVFAILLGACAWVRSSPQLRERVRASRIGSIAGSFIEARPLDWAIILM